MAFSITCTNKGCCKIQEPYIDPLTNKIYCSLCDKEIENITIFVKNQMKLSKQFKQKVKVSFCIKCEKCKKESRPKIVNDDIVCPNCNNILDNLSLPFKNMLKDQLKKLL